MNTPIIASDANQHRFRILKRLGLALFLIASIAAVGAVAPRLVGNPKPAVHLTHTVSRGNLVVTVTENGAVESSNNKEIKCLVQGGTTVLWVIETGTIVKPGDELVRLDQSQIEDKILQQRIVYETALANKITAESDVSVGEISLTEYTEGKYREEHTTIEKDIFESEVKLRKAELAHQSMQRMTAKGIVSSLQLEGEQFSLESAKKDLDLHRTKLESLEKYNRAKTLQELRSTLRAAQAKLASYEASLELEKTRLQREEKQLENCVIKAETNGMVIFPSMAAWKDTPDIEEGATVREQQTLLMIPDASQMQVKVGIHESKVDRLRIGMPAKIQLQDVTLDGTVSEIAEVTRPAGWWTGNLVKYDTLIKLNPHAGLKPGMSAIVDIELAKHENVLTVPVVAIVENSSGYHCWVQTAQGAKRKTLRLGDTNNEFTIALDGVSDGDQIILNPLAMIDEAQSLAMEPRQPDGSDNKPADNKSAAASKSANPQ